MDVIEKAARALAAEAGKFANPVAFYVEGEAQHRWQAANPGLDYWSEGPGLAPDPDDIASWSILARAVLQAVRTPDDFMIRAGIIERHDSDVPEAWSKATANIYTAMIDALLTECPATPAS
jgi:hypothetical protein